MTVAGLRRDDIEVTFACTRCGKCCTGAPGIVRVAPEEIAGMARVKGMSVDTFVKAYVRSMAGNGESCGSGLLPATGPAAVATGRSLPQQPVLALRERENGDCILLEGKNVCTVYDARPAQCRTYPFWPKHTGSIEAWFQLMREECPGAGFRLRTQPFDSPVIDGLAQGKEAGAGGGRQEAWIRRLVAGVEAIYQELEEELARLKPVCIRRGICCNFKAAGHALYVSAPEWLYFTLKSEARSPKSKVGPVADVGFGLRTSNFGLPPPDPAAVCPFLDGGLCGVREDRFLGCRSYFCDPAFAKDQPVVHEKYLTRMRALADELGIPWQYEPLHQKVEREKLKVNSDE